MKKIISFILVFCFFYNIPMSINAAELGIIKFEAKVPSNLNDSIIINFDMEDGTNAMYRLDKLNEYKASEKIPVGSHKLSSAYIYSDTKKKYKVTCNKEITVKANGTINYKITVAENAAKKDTNTTTDAKKGTNTKTDDKKDTNTTTGDKKTTDKNEGLEEDKENENDNETNNEKEEGGLLNSLGDTVLGIFKTSGVTIIILLGISVIYLYIKKKNE